MYLIWSMLQSLLITGQSHKDRLAKAEALAATSSAKFDTLFFDAETEGGIALAREIVRESFHQPFQSEVLTIIVGNADKLTPEAQSALLKTLEEPSEKTQLILLAPTRNSLIATVSSRCLEVNLTAKASTPNNNFASQSSLAGAIEQLEKTGLEPALANLRQELLLTIEGNDPTAIKTAHKQNKITLKLMRAAKSSANKKLLALLLALELQAK